MNIGSTAGQWTAFIQQGFTRQRRLRLVRRSHSGPGNAAHDPVAGTTTPIKDYEVSFKLTELPEGDWTDDAAITASYADWNNGGDEITDFMRAIVNEAAKNGIFPDGIDDMTREIATLKQHLEDMRKLVFKGQGYEKLSK